MIHWILVATLVASQASFLRNELKQIDVAKFSESKRKSAPAAWRNAHHKTLLRHHRSSEVSLEGSTGVTYKTGYYESFSYPAAQCVGSPVVSYVTLGACQPTEPGSTAGSIMIKSLTVNGNKNTLNLVLFYDAFCTQEMLPTTYPYAPYLCEAQETLSLKLGSYVSQIPDFDSVGVLSRYCVWLCFHPSNGVDLFLFCFFVSVYCSLYSSVEDCAARRNSYVTSHIPANVCLVQDIDATTSQAGVIIGGHCKNF